MNMSNMIKCLILELWKNKCQQFDIKHHRFEKLFADDLCSALNICSAMGSTKHLNLELSEKFFEILLPCFPTMEDISLRKDFIDYSLLSNPALTIDLLLASP